ncbi:glycosyl hydrolase family 30 TIM-barrel domain-containing protein [Ditylenchus destructor]|nr:glycosyl hydrolase family 30 TIM-barrel domain-containing protein [Ditylenchus destructor]
MRLLYKILNCIVLGVSNVSSQASNNPCVQKVYKSPSDIVCVCNATYCDTVAPIGDLQSNQAALYVTTKSGKRLEKSILTFSEQLTQNANNLKTGDVRIVINTSRTFQHIVGFGGAFTDSAGINLNRLSSAARRSLMNSYFDKSGIQYTLGRVPMASTDFSTHAYSYCDTTGDFGLTTFNLTVEDFALKIPYILEAEKLAGEMYLFASPWSAPGWMKSSGRMVGPGALLGTFNGQYYVTWANYFLRFFEEYYKQGIKFWGVTLENEPSAGDLPGYKWQALFFSARMMRDFAADLWGPTLKGSNITSNLKLMVIDDQRYTLPDQADVIFANPNASKYVDGIAVHWYWDEYFNASILNDTHNRHPNKFILPTEACNGYLSYDRGVSMGNWTRGELYGKDIIEDLQNWAVGWTDWNLCLDEGGGPNFVNNIVDAPIIVNNTVDEFYKQPMFYVLGHFSKFVRPCSVRLGMKIETNPQLDYSDLHGVVFRTLDEKIVVVLQNRHHTNSYGVFIPNPRNTSQTLNFLMESDSIATVVWNN